jgi:hypothetical protein
VKPSRQNSLLLASTKVIKGRNRTTIEKERAADTCQNILIIFKMHISINRIKITRFYISNLIR